MKNKKIYAVCVMKVEMEIVVGGIHVNALPASGLANGCCGILPCFSSKKAAKKYGGKNQILELQQMEGEG